MNCEEARALLLEAEPAALRTREGALGAHLDACPECARSAAAILAQDAALDDALRTLAVPSAAAPRRRGWRRAAALVPLAAAAALALLVWRGNGGYAPIVIEPEEVPTSTIVNSTGSSGVAVMQTRDPDITVIWNY